MSAVTNATRRVLVVDDNTAIADTLALVLSQHGFDADAVYSGAEAIKYALQSPPDWIVMDVVMSEIDGVDAAIAICETLPHCRILLMSGEVDALKRLAKGYDRGHSFELLIKPIETTVLLERLRAVGSSCVAPH